MDLTAWLEARGVVVSPGIAAAQTADRGTGVVATRQIREGEHLVQFPVASLLTPRHARKALGITGLSAHQALALFLYVECEKRDSDYRPFLDVLPDDFSTVPLAWLVSNTNGRRFALLPPETRAHALAMLDRFKADMKSVEAVVRVDVDRFLRSWLCVNSRCLYYKIPNTQTEDCMTLAPMVDFLNHSDRAQCAIGVHNIHGRRYFCLTARQPYAAGDEILLSYGAHVNSFLLCEYGFTLASNAHAELDVSHHVLALLPDSKKHFLDAHGYLADYTLSRSAVSFRTEVALAAAHSDELERIKAFMAGASDGKRFEKPSRLILADILRQVIEEANGIIQSLDPHDTDERNIINIYNERVQIAIAHLRCPAYSPSYPA